MKKNFSLLDWVVLVFCLLWALVAALVSVHRFWQYDVFYYDFGIFDAAIWNLSRFRPPIIDHLEVGGKIIFADHFNPSIFLLAPIYWLTKRSEALLITQAVIVATSGWVLYLIGRRVVKDKLLALAVTVAYLLFVGLQNAAITDFHEVTVMTLPLMLVFYGLVTERKLLYWISLITTLGFKESTFLLGLGIGIYILLTKRQWWREALMTIVISVLWSITTTRFLIPVIAGRPYLYQPELPQGLFNLLKAFADDPIKRKTLFYSFASFGFLPLLHPAIYPLILQDIAVRFLPKFTNLRWDLGMHYSAQLAPILGFSTIMGLAELKKGLSVILGSPATSGSKRVKLPLIAFLLIAVSLFLHQFKLHGPLGLAYNPAFYRHSRNFQFIDELIVKIPQGASVMAQNNIAPHFIHRNKTYLLRENYGDLAPEYIILDMREGQNPNNFFGIKSPERSFFFLSRDPDYQIFYQTDKQFIFKRVL